MSTYYHLVCEQHRVCSHVIGGRSFPDRWWSNDRGELEQFLAEHADCKPNPILVNEHDERTYSDEYQRYPYPEDEVEEKGDEAK